MIIVPDGRRGFFSYLIWYINCCHIAEKNNDDILIPKFSPHYHNPPKYRLYNETSRGFLQYFEDPLKIVNKEIKYEGKTFEYVDYIENIIPYKNVEICGFILDYELKKYMRFLINKYLIIKPHIKRKIENYSKCFENKKVLGVHTRQTDLYKSLLDNKYDNPVEFQTYINKIKENDFDALYIMSDNIESINKIKNIFKDKEIYYIKDIIRSEKETENPVFRNENNSETIKYKLGEDILIEEELLSLCDKILITNSNISSFVLANNPDIKYEYLDLGINNL